MRRLNVPPRPVSAEPRVLHGAGIAGIGGGGLGGGIGDVARLGDGFERLAFVFHVTLGGLDEIGNQVVAALELHVDLRVGVFEPVAQGDEFVVTADDKANEAQHHHQHDDDKNQDNRHIFPLFRSPKH